MYDYHSNFICVVVWNQSLNNKNDFISLHSFRLTIEEAVILFGTELYFMNPVGISKNHCL
jgi:hypothetical protein